MFSKYKYTYTKSILFGLIYFYYYVDEITPNKEYEILIGFLLFNEPRYAIVIKSSSPGLLYVKYRLVNWEGL